MASKTPTLPKSTLILLVRHGQTSTTGKVLPGRAVGLHLNPTGRAQAAAVAERIAPLEPTAVYASPMERTQETAVAIGERCRRRVRSHEGLIECEFGKWTGRRLNDLRRKREWAAVQSHPSGFRFPAGESFAEMQSRMVDTLGALHRRHQGKTVVAVSHADPVKAAASWAVGAPLDLFQRIVISPCSVTALLVGAHAPIVLAINSLGDLTELAPS
ncbi:MAG TPA: histidine phosphatase family protein [Acidimicrobiales bacterium]|jgi:probable phosphoglycerate mutase